MSNMKNWQARLQEIIFRTDTPAGKTFDVLLIVGYSIIAVPTRIVTAEITQQLKKQGRDRSCTQCSADNHDDDADHCKYCGTCL